jgi:hypothetical protein
MSPEQIQEKLDKFFGLKSFLEYRGKRRILYYPSPTNNIELFHLELFNSDTDGWTLGSITHSLSGHLEHLNQLI